MLKKVEIPIFQVIKESETPIGDPLWRETWAWVDGPFAIHKWLGNFDGPPGWSVTHIASGCRLNYKPLTKTEAVQRLAWAKRFQWRGRKVLEDMPVCELLQLAPLIHQEMLPHRDDLSDWSEKQRPAIERAHHCPDIVHHPERAHA